MAIDVKAPKIGPKEEAAEVLKRVNVRAKLGDIVHPWTDTRFTVDALKPHILDAWITMQKNAGILEVTE